MYGYVYMTINIINGKRYIGQHKSSKFQTKYKYIGSGKYLQRAINKYGIDNFAIELLDTAESLDELNYKEWYWIEYYNAVDNKMFYNEIPGGQVLDISGSNNPNYNNHKLKGKVFTDIHKNRIGDSLKGRIIIHKGSDERRVYSYELERFISEGYEFGHSDITRDKISLSVNNKIRIHNDMHEKFVDKIELNYYLSIGYKIGHLSRGKLSESHRNKIKKSMSGRIVINNGVTVLRVTEEEYRARYSNWNRGFLNKTKEKLSKRNSGSNNPMYKRSGKWMNNGIINKFVSKKDQNELLKLGWKFGMIKKGGAH